MALASEAAAARIVFIYINTLHAAAKKIGDTSSTSSPYRYAAASLFMRRAKLCVAPLLDCYYNGEAGERTMAWLDGSGQDEREVCDACVQTTHDREVIHTSTLQHAGGRNRRRSGRGLDGDGDRIGVATNRPRPLIADRTSSTDAEARFLAYAQVQLRVVPMVEPSACHPPSSRQ